MRPNVFVTLVMFAILGCLQPPSLAEGLPSNDGARSSSTTITVYDPDDLAPCEIPPWCSADIRLASLRSFIGGTGRRMLAVTVVAYEPHARVTEVSIKLRFDANGGPPADWYFYMGFGAFGNVGMHQFCGKYLWTRRYRTKVDGELMTCFIPERDLHPTKPIRFQALSRMIRGVEDRAPDAGWAG